MGGNGGRNRYGWRRTREGNKMTTECLRARDSSRPGEQYLCLHAVSELTFVFFFPFPTELRSTRRLQAHQSGSLLPLKLLSVSMRATRVKTQLFARPRRRHFYRRDVQLAATPSEHQLQGRFTCSRDAPSIANPQPAINNRTDKLTPNQRCCFFVFFVHFF